MLLKLLILSLLLTVTSNKANSVIIGDLLQIDTKNGLIGALVEEFKPHGKESYKKAEEYFLSRDDEWWRQRVRKQLDLTLFRLVFRSAFYEGVGPLVIPHEEAQNITFLNQAKRMVVDGHPIIGRSYRMQTFMVGKLGTAALSDEKLGVIGGQVSETFVLPVDPQLVVQRTGYACMDEDQFPYNSIDPESQEVYYDDSCTAGKPNKGENTICRSAFTGCHCTREAKRNCPLEVKHSVGRSILTVTFTRIPWNEAIATQMESLNEIKLDPKAKGADLVGYDPGLEHSWIIYRYFKPNSCESQECIDGDGWRKILMFDGVHVNIGTDALNIGNLVYTDSQADSFNPQDYQNLYYFDKCHQHPHFSAYSNYNYGPVLGHKQGFCIQDTNRYVNHRNVTIRAPYDSCSNQGISVGWADNYNGGIPCQWIDISLANKTSILTQEVNPKNWLCEGNVIRNQTNGDYLFVPTGEVTQIPPYPYAGKSINKWKCETSPGALNNNVDELLIPLPPHGEGLLTTTCPDAGHRLGPKRDCEFQVRTKFENCQAGKKVRMKCKLDSTTTTPQILRVCEASHHFQSGTACRVFDDFTLSNVVVRSQKNWKSFEFICPKARDQHTEIGGVFATYIGALLNGIDSVGGVICEF